MKDGTKETNDSMTLFTPTITEFANQINYTEMKDSVVKLIFFEAA